MALNLSGTPNTVEVEGAGRRIELLDEAGEPYMDGDKPVTALVAGVYSKRFTDKQQKISERNARRSGKLSPEQRAADARENFAVCVLEWDIELDGAPIADIFKFKPHIYEQIITAANDHAGFFSAPSTS